KLRFDSADAARTAVIAAGAEPIRSRRLQEDCLLDTADETLRRRRCVLRVRMESGKSLLTYKGPVQPSDMPLREELETIVADGPLLLRILEELGLRVWFRYQKYREEFVLDDSAEDLLVGAVRRARPRPQPAAPSRRADDGRRRRLGPVGARPVFVGTAGRAGQRGRPAAGAASPCHR